MELIIGAALGALSVVCLFYTHRLIKRTKDDD